MGTRRIEFKPLKDVRQGCPLSPFLFILSAIKLRYVPEVKGINLFGNELKLPKFVDDTNPFCADLTSVEKALRVCPREDQADVTHAISPISLKLSQMIKVIKLFKSPK